MNTKHYILPIILIFVFTFLFIGGNNVQANNVKNWFDEDQNQTDPNESEDTKIEENKEEITIGSKNRSLVWDLIKMVFVLLLILALIYLLLRFINKRNKISHQVRSLENLGGISVGQNKSVQLVRVGKRIYLLGVGDNVELLEEIMDDDVREDLLHKDPESSNIPSNFLVDFFSRKTNKEKTHQNNDEKKFQQLFSTELGKLKQTRKKIIGQHTEKEDKHG